MAAVTVDLLRQWDGDRLGRVADELHDRRSALTDLADEVDAGRPPESWVGGASVHAEQDHDQLAHRLTDQVAELNRVISSLDAASGEIRGARTLLDDALARAQGAGCTVAADGAVTDPRTYDDADELAEAQRVVDEIAQAVGDALRRAGEADATLAAALGAATRTDVDAVGGLGDQTLPDALRGLTTEQQVSWLLDHPDHADVVLPSLPDPLKDALGRGLSDLVDGEVNDEDFDLDEATVDRLDGLLDAYGSDEGVASSFYRDLGADGTVATLGSIEGYLRLGGMDPDRVLGLADGLRQTLGTASAAPGFDSHGFGEDLARYATWQLDDDQRDAYQDRYPYYSGSGASILTYLMRDHGLDGELVLGAAEQLDAFERQTDFPGGAQGWYSHNGFSPLNADEEYDGWYDDPMAAALGNLGDHPEDGYRFLTDDPARQDYYFRERSWEADGFAGVSQLVEGVGTDPGVLEQHPHETAGLVSEALHGLATNESFGVDTARDGSPYLADLMKHYTPAVDNALRFPGDGTEPGVWTLTQEHVGTFEDYPILLEDDLDVLMQVAVSTDDGATSIAEGIGAYQQTQVHSVAAELAAHPDDPRAINELRDVLQGTAGLRGFAEHSVGSVEIGEAEDHDARVAAFSDLVSNAAGLVPLPGSGLAGEVLQGAWEHGVELGSDALGEAYGNQTEPVTASAENRAEVGATRMKVDAFLALAQAGVIPQAEVPEMWLSGGSLISAGDIPPGQLGSYGQSAGDGLNDFVTNYDLEGAYKNDFISYYGRDGD